MTVCRHSVLDKRATNKSSVRNRATNKIGIGRKVGESGRPITKVEWISDAGEVGRRREFKRKN